MAISEKTIARAVVVIVVISALATLIGLSIMAHQVRSQKKIQRVFQTVMLKHMNTLESFAKNARTQQLALRNLVVPYIYDQQQKQRRPTSTMTDSECEADVTSVINSWCYSSPLRKTVSPFTTNTTTTTVNDNDSPTKSATMSSTARCESMVRSAIDTLCYGIPVENPPAPTRSTTTTQSSTTTTQQRHLPPSSTTQRSSRSRIHDSRPRNDRNTTRRPPKMTINGHHVHAGDHRYGPPTA
jgi:hypothetical protein